MGTRPGPWHFRSQVNKQSRKSGLRLRSTVIVDAAPDRNPRPRFPTLSAAEFQRPTDLPEVERFVDLGNRPAAGISGRDASHSIARCDDLAGRGARRLPSVCHRRHGVGMMAAPVATLACAFRDQPIYEARQHGCFARVERNESYVVSSRNTDRRKWCQKSTRRDIRLKDRQRTYPDAKAIDHSLKRDKKMIENAPTLFDSMKQPGTFKPVGPITWTRLTTEKDVVRDIGGTVKRCAFEQARTDD
jgi:hypothetical protein